MPAVFRSGCEPEGCERRVLAAGLRLAPNALCDAHVAEPQLRKGRAKRLFCGESCIGQTDRLEAAWVLARDVGLVDDGLCLALLAGRGRRRGTARLVTARHVFKVAVAPPVHAAVVVLFVLIVIIIVVVIIVIVSAATAGASVEVVLSARRLGARALSLVLFVLRRFGLLLLRLSSAPSPLGGCFLLVPAVAARCPDEGSSPEETVAKSPSAAAAAAAGAETLPPANRTGVTVAENFGLLAGTFAAGRGMGCPLTADEDEDEEEDEEEETKEDKNALPRCTASSAAARAALPTLKLMGIWATAFSTRAPEEEEDPPAAPGPAAAPADAPSP